MIAENEQQEPQPEDERPELEPADMKTLMHILLIRVNGIRVAQKTFDEYDKQNIEFSRQWDPNSKTWNFFVAKKRKRGIIKPRKKLILPGDT